MTLHTIFRSGSLVSNMLMGVAVMGKSYRTDKYVSVIFITIGIVLCTLMSTGGETKDAGTAQEQLIGIALLSFALLVSSGMGLLQEKTYAKFGKHPSEALFIDHVLGLPLFYFSYNSIADSFTSLLDSEPIALTSSFNMP